MKNRCTNLTRQAETFNNVLFRNIIEKGFYPSIFAQARRLFTCSFHFMGKSGGYVFGRNLNLIEQYNLWIGDGKNDFTPDLFAAKVQLNNEFFKEFTHNKCFPINIEQIKGISEHVGW